MRSEPWLGGAALAITLAFGSAPASAEDAGAISPPNTPVSATESADGQNSTTDGRARARETSTMAPAIDAGTTVRTNDEGDAGASTNPHEDPHAVDPHRHDPHGTGAHGGDGLFQVPEDGAVEDASLPAGTLEIHVADPSGNPLPQTPVTLGILYNSVAKGESRKRVTVTTNEKGVARVEHLDTGSSVAYRPMVVTGGATFSMMPFRLPENAGMKALLHVYPVVEDIESALVVTQSVVYAEVKDDRIQVHQAFKLYNVGRNAWVPKDFVIPLPEDFSAFTSQQGMSDVGVDAVPKKGARVRGTFGPGQHVVEFRWQLPYSGEDEVQFDVGMPPRMATSRVIAPASKGMTLDVPGFPAPQSTNDGQGQRALVTERTFRREEPALNKVTVIIRGLPTEGPGKVVATILSAGGVLIGLVLGTRKPAKRDRKAERTKLLEELEELERAHRAGDVGPKTYERARRELIDELARTFWSETRLRPRKAKRS